MTVASPPLPEVAFAVGLDVASPVLPEVEVASDSVVVSPELAELSEDELAVASPERPPAPLPLLAASAAAPDSETTPSSGAPVGPPVAVACWLADPLVAVPVDDDDPVVPPPPGPEVALLVAPLVELAGPVLPPVPVALEVDEPDEPLLAEPLVVELAGPELPPVASEVTSPESPLLTSTAMPPVPPPAPPPAPPVSPPTSPLEPEVPSLLAFPPSPLDAVVSPLDVAPPVSPLVDDDVVLVVDEPDDEPESDEDVELDSPLTAGSSTVRTTAETARGGSSISMAAMAAAKAIFSNMALSVL